MAKNGESSSPEGDVVWLRHATENEVLMEFGQRKRYLITMYCLELSSPQPLDAACIHQALHHLYRQVPTLRLCLRTGQDGELWACERTSDTIDFEVMDGAVPEEVMSWALHEPYDSHQGPLWRARWVPGGSGGHLVLANHHAVADGTSNVRTFGRLVSILDAVVAARDVHDHRQMEQLVDLAAKDAFMADKKAELESNPTELEKLMEKEQEAIGNKPFLLRNTDHDETALTGETKLFTQTLDEDSMKKFIGRCKSEGVSVGSAVSAILYGIIVDIARKEDMEQTDFNIRANHTVNFRRYLGEEYKKALGSFITLLRNDIIVPATWKASFWPFAKRLHEAIHHRLNNDGPIHDELVLTKLFDDSSMEELFNEPFPPFMDITTSHMGLIDNLIKSETSVFGYDEGASRVQIEAMVRATTNWIEPLVFFTHTLKGRYTVTLAYTSNLIATDVAQTIVLSLMEHMRSMA